MKGCFSLGSRKIESRLLFKWSRKNIFKDVFSDDDNSKVVMMIQKDISETEPSDSASWLDG